MKTICKILILFILTSCSKIDNSLDNTVFFKDFNSYASENEIINDSLINSINFHIDSIEDTKNSNRKYYILAKLHNNLGYSHYTKSDFDIAIREYIEALNNFDKIKNNEEVLNLRADIYRNIADIFYDCENYTLSKNIYEKALEYSLESSDSINIVYNYRMIGNLCYYLSEDKNNDTLLHYMQKSMNFTQNEEPLISALYMTLTSAYREIDRIDSIFPNRFKGLSLLPDNKDGIYYSLNNYLSIIYTIEGNIEEAIKCSEINLKSDNIKKQITAHQQLSHLYLINKDTLSSIYHNKQYDSLLNIFSEHKRKFYGSEEFYHNYENEYQKSNHKKRKHDVVIFISIASIFIIISSLFFIRKKKKTSNENNLNSQWEKFISSDIYTNIKNKCEKESELNANNVSTSLICLTENEKNNLEQEINNNFNNFVNKIKDKYPELNKGELEYCIISLLKISEIHKAALLGLSYQGCVSRKKRVMEKTKMTNINEDILLFLKNIMTT